MSVERAKQRQNLKEKLKDSEEMERKALSGYFTMKQRLAEATKTVYILEKERELLRNVEIALDEMDEELVGKLPESVTNALEKLWEWRKEKEEEGTRL